MPQDRRERYCRKAACLQASKEARLAREAASIKKAADKQAVAEVRLARLKKKLKPAKPVFVALLPMQNDRRAQAVDPTDWAAMEQAAAHWCRVKDEQNAKEKLAAKERLAAEAAEASAAETQVAAASAAKQAAAFLTPFIWDNSKCWLRLGTFIGTARPSDELAS